jgi:hypothetical protein
MFWIIWAAAIVLYLLLCVAVGRFLRLSSINEAAFQEFITAAAVEIEEELESNQEEERDVELLLRG